MRSYNVQIWVGLRIGYSNEFHTLDDVRAICDAYISEINDCITITPTEYRYVNGWENGVVIGLIQYPRFPRKVRDIKKMAMLLANKLLVGLALTIINIKNQNTLKIPINLIDVDKKSRT